MLGWMLSKFDEHERDRERSRSAGGGGGRVRIRLGRTGPRGRIYSKSSTMRSSIAKASYVCTGGDALRHITAHLSYILKREKGELERGKEREFFGREEDEVDRAEVELEMKESRGRKVAMHKLILSPGDNNVDLKDYTRESMEALERRLGHELTWYGVEHLNTDHHHVHLVVAGRIPDRERDREYGDAQEREGEAEKRHREQRKLDSKRTRSEARLERMLDRIERDSIAKEAARQRGDVYLDRNDLRELRAAGNEYRIRERSFDRALERAFEREFERAFEREPERVREIEKERPSRESGYDRGEAEKMIELLLSRTESTDRYKDMVDRMAEEKRELPDSRDESLDRVLGAKQSKGKDQDLDKQKDKQREQLDYQQRTGFAGREEQAEDSARTFEADRLTESQQQSQDQTQERSRDDDLDRFDDFGR